MSRYDDLIAMLEDADEPSRSLDRAIHAYASAKVVRDETFINGPKNGQREIERVYPFSFGCWFAPAYTRSMTCAAALAPGASTFAVGDCNENDVPWACVTYRTIDYAATAATPEIALCLAAIKAREAWISA